MPSLLSRFLGKKKSADSPALLDGEKFEAVPKTTSPLVATFADSAQGPKSKGKERRKNASPNATGNNGSKFREQVPVLSLRLPESQGEEKQSQGLGVVFEGITEGPADLDDEALGEKRLTPSETLILTQKISEVINERGLETLGVMRPHWFASPRQQEIQLKLVNRFLQTLSTQQANGAQTSSQASFESELRYSRDPHDVAAVLRWGLRHLQLQGDSFASSDTSDWYRTFSDSERSGSFPPKAFDEILVPLLPAPHAQLLRATLDLVSSLAAHSEENGISGNKLSKVLGWWIISSRNIQGANWSEFYAQWETAARQFEHLFLAYIRAQEAQSRMPRRLSELVKYYPFAKNRQETDGIYLPRSRFSTRSADSLFVRVTADGFNLTSRPHPLRVIEDAFKAQAGNESKGEYVMLWEELRKIASKPPQPGDESSNKEGEQGPVPVLNLSAILTDESVRLLSLVPTPEGPDAPTVSLITSLPSGRGRRSLSVGDRSPTNGRSEGSSAHSKAATAPARQPDVPTDWQSFSSSGFQSPSGLSLAASLWDNDTEVTQPVPKKGFTAGKRNLSTRSARRGSLELPARTLHANSAAKAKPQQLTYGAPRLVKLDEAFIDFWADSLLDSIARTWPTFVVCQLKPSPALRITENAQPIEWLIIERVAAETAHRAPLTLKTSAASARAASPVQQSPTKSEPSKSSRWAATSLAGTRKRWSFFSPKHESAPAMQDGRGRAAKKAVQGAKVGELGEILKEEDEGKPNGVNANGPVKEVHTPKKQAEKPPPPVIQVNGVPKSEDLVAPKPEEVDVPESPKRSTATAEHSPGQVLPVVQEKVEPAVAQKDALPTPEKQHDTQSASTPAPLPDSAPVQSPLPAQEPAPIPEPVSLQDNVQPAQPPATEAPVESQPIAEASKVQPPIDPSPAPISVPTEEHHPSPVAPVEPQASLAPEEQAEEAPGPAEAAEASTHLDQAAATSTKTTVPPTEETPHDVSGLSNEPTVPSSESEPTPSTVPQQSTEAGLASTASQVEPMDQHVTDVPEASVEPAEVPAPEMNQVDTASAVTSEPVNDEHNEAPAESVAHDAAGDAPAAATETVDDKPIEASQIAKTPATVDSERSADAENPTKDDATPHEAPAGNTTAEHSPEVTP